MKPLLETGAESMTLRVEGDLVSTNAPVIRGQIDRLFEPANGLPPAWKIFKLDLSTAKMIDSVGLNLVVSLLKRVQRHGGRMQVAFSDSNVLRILNFTRLDKQVELIKV